MVDILTVPSSGHFKVIISNLVKICSKNLGYLEFLE